MCLQSVVFHDVVKRNVYVSDDEGKTWALAPGVPEGEAMMVIEHPFDKNYVCYTAHLHGW